jgi:hypothetical protein
MITLLINSVRACLLCAVFLWVVPCRGQTPEPQIAFLTERVSIKTKVGVTGIPGGTRVVIVSRHGDQVTVKTTDQQFDVTADQLTTDRETARQLSDRDVREQERLQKDAAERELRYEESVANRRKAEASNPSPVTPQNGALDRQLNEIRKERERLKIELDRVKFDLKELPPPNSSHRTSRPYAHPNIVVQTSPNAFNLQQRRKDIERRLMELDQQERLLKLQAR